MSTGPMSGEEVNLRAAAIEMASDILIVRESVEDELLAAAQALEIERAQLGEAQALAKIGSWRHDLRERVTVWSEENYRIFGMPYEERGASYEAFVQRVHPEDRGTVQAALDAAIVAHAPYVLDHRLLLPDGTLKWVQGRCQFSYDGAGKPLTAVGTVQDITERKNAEAILHHNEQLLRLASRVGRIGGWNIDLETFTVSWSDAVGAIHGVPPGHRSTLYEAVNFYAPEYREEVRRCVGACVTDGKPFDLEAQIINTAGERVWVRLLGEAEFSPTGTLTRVGGALQDISERMNALDALRASDQRFRLVARATSDVVWDWDIANDVIWWGDGLQTKLGYPTTVDASVQFWSDNIHPDDRQRIAGGIEAAIASGTAWSDEYRFRKADGTYIQVFDRALIELDASGRVSRMLGAMVDVTEQRTLEARLEEVQRISSLGQLAGNMAHEFNNVLMGIQPFVEVIRRVTPGIAKAQEALDRIGQSVKRGKDITDEILRYTRLATPAVQPVDVREWLVEFASQSDALSAEAEAVDTMPPPEAASELRDIPQFKHLFAKPLNTATAGSRKITSTDVEVHVAPSPAAETKRLPKTVLIVDDEPAVVEGISMLLASEGVQSVSIFEGAGTIEHIERHAPELVLLDIGLPDVSGVEVYKQIHLRWPRQRVIFMTGHYSRSDLGSILENPYVGFLQKPFGVEELIAAIQV